MANSRFALLAFLPVVALLATQAFAPVSVTGVAAEQQQPADAVKATALPDAAEFPQFDREALSLAGRAPAARALARRLAEAPEDPDTPRLLAGQRRFDELLVTLRRIVQTHPERIARAFDFPLFALSSDHTRNYPAEVLSLVALARTRLTNLSREDAAATARTLLNVESQLDPQRSRNRIPRLKAFVEEYAGTDTALAAEVDLLQQAPPSVSRLAALEAFARRHPGTCAAAKAVFQRGMDLAVNATSLRIERPGDDPLARFTQVAAIARDLQSGDYPRCEWTDKATDLIVKFSAFRPTFSSRDHIDTMLDAYRDLLGKEVPKLPGALAGSTLDFVIVTRMGDLFALRGDRIAGVESVYAELERAAPNPGAVKFARALFYLRFLIEPTADRPAVVAKAAETLRALHADRVQPFARRALATLASLQFHERDYATARASYMEYISLYPGSDWAWVARLRLGECATALDDLPGAARAYAAAANAPGTLAFARVVALASSSDVLAELGQLTNALRDASQALAAWDDEYGDSYRTEASQARLPGESPFAIDNERTIMKAGLRARVGELAVSAANAGGASLEQGRRMLARHHAPDAVPVLRRAATESRGKALETSARSLLHHAQLTEALPRVEADRTAALRMLETLDAEPLDFYTFAARVARATLLSMEPATAIDADRVMTEALQAWQARQPLSAPAAPGSLEADVSAIRAEVVRPLGGGVYSTTRWNAFAWPAELPRFMIANPDLEIRLPGGDTRRVSLRQPIAGLSSVIFMSDQELAVLTEIMSALGGNALRAPTSVMQTPNQPAGASLDVRAFWNRYFPTRPDHWAGWVFETYPTIADITFLDAGRTRAAARVVVGYSGATVILVKEGGEWRAKELTEFWVT